MSELFKKLSSSEKLSMVKAVASEGLSLWTQSPARLKLRFEETKLSKNGDFTIIYVSLYDEYYKTWHRHSLVINNTTKEINWSNSSRILSLDRMHHSSGEIGAIIFSLPLAILCLPYIIFQNCYYLTQEKISGYSRHDRAILNALKGQLDQKTKALLVEAFKKTRAKDQYYSQKISFAKAKDFLRQQHLNKAVFTEKNGRVFETYNWFDDKNNLVAQVHPNFRPTEIRVLGSYFYEEKAEQLCFCFRTQKVKEYRY